jgi:hypothetical protein
MNLQDRIDLIGRCQREFEEKYLDCQDLLDAICTHLEEIRMNHFREMSAAEQVRLQVELDCLAYHPMNWGCSPPGAPRGGHWTGINQPNQD